MSDKAIGQSSTKPIPRRQRRTESSERTTPKVRRGLIGVYFDRSSICSIDGEHGRLSYRGYSIDDLATRSSFEEVAFLLIHGELPTATELREFAHGVREAAPLPEPVTSILGQLRSGHPMDAIRTGLSALAVFDPQTHDRSMDATIRKAVRLIGQVPTLVATHHRLRQGLAIVDPDPSLGYAANLLYMLTGTRPTGRISELVDRDLILHAEHGPNASTFAARVAAGTDADLHAALTVAFATLSGPAHGGAAEDVMKMVVEVGSADHAEAFVRVKRAAHEPVVGFGHRVYRTEDPRARFLRDGVRALSIDLGQPEWFEILEAIVGAMRPYARRGVHVNVDFYAGALYHLLGLPGDLFVPIFAIGRLPGWIAHVLEQLEHNILIRPLALYDGPGPRAYVPVEGRTTER